MMGLVALASPVPGLGSFLSYTMCQTINIDLSGELYDDDGESLQYEDIDGSQ